MSNFATYGYGLRGYEGLGPTSYGFGLGILVGGGGTVGVIVRADWDAFELVDREVESLWDVEILVFEPVASDSKALWNVAEFVTRNVNAKWLARIFVNDEVQAVWNNNNPITQISETIWDQQALVSVTSETLWNLEEFINSAVEIVWGNRDLISDDVDTPWDVHVLVGEESSSLWNIADIIAQQVGAEWDVATFVTDETEVLWRDLDVIGGEVSGVWHVYLGGIGQVVEVLWVTKSYSPFDTITVTFLRLYAYATEFLFPQNEILFLTAQEGFDVEIEIGTDLNVEMTQTGAYEVSLDMTVED